MTSFDVTHRIQQLGSQDSTTGWYTPFYHVETDSAGNAVPEKLIFIPKASSPMLTVLGTYVRLDAIGFTLDPVRVGDQYKIGLQWYEVKAVRDIMHFGGGSLSRREVDLELLEFEQLTGVEYGSSDVEDAKYRTKVWLKKYLNNSALPKYIIAYDYPTYDIIRVFRDKGVDLVFSIGEPVTTPILNADKTVSFYTEIVPTQVVCITKTNINGKKLQWQAETELRRIAETYHFGSLRLIDERRDKSRDLGNTMLYATELKIAYKREPS